jgi:DnaJ-class molecular chaperone
MSEVNEEMIAQWLSATLPVEKAKKKEDDDSSDMSELESSEGTDADSSDESGMDDGGEDMSKAADGADTSDDSSTCATCGGKGTIRGGHVTCPDCGGDDDVSKAADHWEALVIKSLSDYADGAFDPDHPLSSFLQ